MPRSRSVSISSDAAPKTLLTSPPHVDPSPAFIAASSASQIVSVDMEQNEIANSDDASISPNGLILLNGFLDYLLFSFLASAKSTQLSALRPAIAEVLKPRLAREVVSTADEELQEYMGGNDEDELQEFRGGRAPHGEFDLVRAWKLARLRCMVYTRLGDLEEEEEDEYIAQEGLDETGGAPRRFSGHAGNITPAAAIFLTSIIENLGEHALVIAGENARNRYFSAARVASKSASPNRADIKMVVDDSDMEKIALNPTLGRLWRAWKKGIRTPTLSRAFSRESFARRSPISNKDSVHTVDQVVGTDSKIYDPVEEEERRPKSIDPADIALPMNDDDVDEIETPGLWTDVEEAQTMQAAVAQKVRPRSLIILRSGTTTPTSSSPRRTAGTWPATNSPQHTRSQSVPVLVDIFKSSDHGALRESRPSLETVTETDGNEAFVTPKSDISMSNDNEEVTTHTSQKKTLDNSHSLATTQQEAGNEGDTQKDEDRRSSGDEVVEGQGTYQRPNLNNLSMQRPKRKVSRDAAKKETLPTYVLEEQSPPAGYHDDRQPPMQGGAIAHDMSSFAQSNVSPAGDSLHSHLHGKTPGPITHGIAPTSHPRQLESTTEPSTEENATDVPRDSLNASRHASSLYSESIGAPQSTSDESEGSVYRSIPSRTASRAASHATSTRSQTCQEDHSTPRDRVAVQRVYVGSSTSQASIKSRRSGSISEKRPLTSGSATSNVSTKLKVLIGRHPAEIDVPLPAPPRRSSDASKFTSDDTDQTTLDQLIKSDETIRFTLTPRTMREIEMPGSPRWNTARNDIHNDRTNTSDLAEFFRNTAPPGEPLPSPRIPTERDLPTPRMKPSSPAIDGLRVDTVSEKSSPTISVHSPASPISQVSNRSKSTMHQARGPRVTSDSVRDFAQFIRSTGPGAGDVSGRVAGNTTHLRDGSESLGASRPDTAQSASSRTTARPRESYNSNRPRLQAREASGHNSGKTSDLIDFIREGPPGASTHRIPRTVAPFRNTMDSEDLVLMETARDNNARMTPSLASTGAESTSSSRAPLLAQTNPSDAPPIPRRKRRGPRDPYAIDFSDDDDFEEISVTTKSSNAPRTEESLLDFLNSVPPPVSQNPPEPFILSSQTAPPRTSSGQSAKTRFRRNTFVDKIPSPTLKKSMTSMRSAKLSSSAKTQISQPLPQSSRHPPVPMIPKLDGQSGFQPNLGNGRGFQPTGLSARQTETGALADFLRSTGPPEPIPRASSTFSEDKKDSSFSRFFRRKRVEA